jgi:CheY-like chemotaxis protein
MSMVLVVDDEADARMMVGKFLSLSGHKALFASNGWEALLTLDSTQVDLVILDLLMPGMDGLTFLRILRQSDRTFNVPVMVVTAVGFEEASRRTKSLGVMAVLCKGEALFEGISAVLSRITADAIRSTGEVRFPAPEKS